MNINRYNYEEFFLLYVDRELNEAERKAVEDFVAANPDLKNELTSLADAVLIPETAVSFPNKEDLLSHLQLNDGTCEAYFILYADNELSNAEKAKVEKFVYSNPQHQEAFELYQQVKFEADRSIVFPDKRSLLKQAADARIIPLWLKFSASAAAAVIFIIFGYLQFNNDTEVGKSPLLSKNIRVDSGALPTAKSAVITIPSPEKGSLTQADAVKTAVEEDAVAVKDRQVIKAEPRQVPAAVESPIADVSMLKPARTDNLLPVPEPQVETSTITPDHIQPSLVSNIPVEAPVVVQEEMIQEDQSELRIANFSVTQKSGLGRMIRRTSRFLNKTAKITPSKPGLVIGNLEIALR